MTNTYDYASEEGEFEILANDYPFLRSISGKMCATYEYIHEHEIVMLFSTWVFDEVDAEKMRKSGFRSKFFDLICEFSKSRIKHGVMNCHDCMVVFDNGNLTIHWLQDGEVDKLRDMWHSSE